MTDMTKSTFPYAKPSEAERLARDAEWARSRSLVSNFDDSSRFHDLHKILHRGSSFAAESSKVSHPECHFRTEDEEGWPTSGLVFEPGKATSDYIASCPILCVGAGGLGCEILKNLALSGFKNIHVIDGDTVDLTNLNRQFLFREGDVGSGKAFAAAAAVMKRCPGVTVTPRCSYIQEEILGKKSLGDLKGPPIDFFRQFKVVVCGLDNVEARAWMSDRLVEFVGMNQGRVDPSTVTPMIDGGTEGFKGQVHLVIPYVNPDFSKRLWMFPKQENFQLCTIAETPRKPEHCVAYAMLMEWDKMAEKKVKTGEWKSMRKYDTDSPSDMLWLYERASERAKKYNIDGVTYFFTMGVVKRIIPAIASSNATVAALSALEALKIVSLCSQTLNNFTLLIGDEGMGCQTHSLGEDKQWHRRMAIKNFKLDGKFHRNKTLADLTHYIANDKSLQEILFQWWYQAVDAALQDEVEEDIISSDDVCTITVLSDIAGVLRVPCSNSSDETVGEFLQRAFIIAKPVVPLYSSNETSMSLSNTSLWQDPVGEKYQRCLQHNPFNASGSHKKLDNNTKLSEILVSNNSLYMFQNPLMPCEKMMLKDEWGEHYILDQSGVFSLPTDVVSSVFEMKVDEEEHEILLCVEHDGLAYRGNDAAANNMKQRHLQVRICIQ
eukprot:g4702.t1